MDKQAALELFKAGAVAAVGIKLLIAFSEVFGPEVAIETIKFVIPFSIIMVLVTVVLYLAWD